MCKMMEDMRKEVAAEVSNEKAIEFATSLLSTNLSIEEIAKHSGLSLDKVKKLAEEKK